MYRIFNLKMIYVIDVLRSKLLALHYNFLVRSLGVDDFTVILCCKNAASSIKLCVESIRRAGGQNLIIVDGWSTDETQEILKNLNESFHLGAQKGLSYDCQIGIDLCTTEYAFFVDADHVIPINFFNEMFLAYQSHGCDFLQSKLSIYEPKGIFNFGENEYYRHVHNIHWTRNMIGTSPPGPKEHTIKVQSSMSEDQLLSKFTLLPQYPTFVNSNGTGEEMQTSF